MAPWSRHFCSISRYSVILFWRFLAAIRLSGLMFSSPMNTRRTPAARRLLDEVRNLVAERIDLDGEADLREFAVAQLDQAVEEHFPVAVAGEIVVGDEEPLDALRHSSSRTICSRSSAVRKRLLRPCTLMMVQNEHW